MESALHARESKTRRENLEAEVEALSGSGTNIPEGYELLRMKLCEVLGRPESDLPFVAELIAIKPAELDWQSPIEAVLRGVGLSLLIPAECYKQASRYINGTQLKDGSGDGQQLAYHRMPEAAPAEFSPAIALPQNCLFKKLEFKEDHHWPTG